VLRCTLCLQAEFVDCVHRQQGSWSSRHAALIKRRLIAEGIVVVYAIDQEDVGFLTLAVDGERSERTALRTRSCAGKQGRQAAEIAPVDRQQIDLRVVDNLRECARIRLQKRRSG